LLDVGGGEAGEVGVSVGVLVVVGVEVWMTTGAEVGEVDVVGVAVAPTVTT
jgi:hypothetical protein